MAIKEAIYIKDLFATVGSLLHAVSFSRTRECFSSNIGFANMFENQLD